MIANGPDETLRDSHPPNAAPRPEVTASSPPPSNGFRARLEGLSLFDLVQMECLARSHRIVRVASSGRVGYLYFRAGEIVHAGTRNLVGERAALEILSWNDGVFEPCHIAWPERTTINTAWQRLLLVSAKARDDHAAGKLVHLPSRRSTPPPAEEERYEEAEFQAEPEPAAGPPTIAEPSVKAPESLTPASVQQAVRIDPSGQVLSLVGKDSEFGGFAAYARRLGDLIGQSLGLEQVLAMDVGFDGSRCIVYVEEKGNVVAIKARSDVDLAQVARRAGV